MMKDHKWYTTDDKQRRVYEKWEFFWRAELTLPERLIFANIWSDIITKYINDYKKNKE
jgi:hypothetical protein